MSQNNILAISGKKDSGKTSLCNFLHAVILSGLHDEEDQPILDWVELDKNGAILVPADNENGWGVLDLNNDDPDFQQWIEDNLSFYIKKFTLSKPLKFICSELLSLDKLNIYGTNDDKNKNTQYNWSQSMMRAPKGRKDDPMTNREVKEYIAKVITDMNSRAFVNYLLREIDIYNSKLSVVEDVRRRDELAALKEHGAKVIRLTRNLHDSQSEVETDLDDVDPSEFDLVIDNQNMTMEETHTKSLEFIQELGWL